MRVCAGALLAGAAFSVAGQAYTLEAIGQMKCREATPYLRQGIAAGNAEAIFLSAQMVARRLCFRYESDVYVRLLRQASELGSHGAMADLAYAYATGEGVAQDYEQAGAWLQKAGWYKLAEWDNYSLGYADALLRRVIARATNFSPPWVSRDHAVEIKLTAHPRTQRVDVELAYRGPEADEAREVMARIREEASNAAELAKRDLPPPNVDRLTSAPVARSLTVIMPRHGGHDTQRPARLDDAAPR